MTSAHAIDHPAEVDLAFVRELRAQGETCGEVARRERDR
jgi:hypothetical protein